MFALRSGFSRCTSCRTLVAFLAVRILSAMAAALGWQVSVFISALRWHEADSVTRSRLLLCETT